MIMKFPDSVSLNTHLAYKPKNNLEPARKLKSEDFDWDSEHPKTLVTLCIEEIADKWKGSLIKN